MLTTVLPIALCLSFCPLLHCNQVKYCCSNTAAVCCSPTFPVAPHVLPVCRMRISSLMQIELSDWPGSPALLWTRSHANCTTERKWGMQQKRGSGQEFSQQSPVHHQSRAIFRHGSSVGEPVGPEQQFCCSGSALWAYWVSYRLFCC